MNRTYGESGTPGEGAAKHLLHLDGREKLKITGVENVDSFEETWRRFADRRGTSDGRRRESAYRTA